MEATATSGRPTYQAYTLPHLDGLLARTGLDAHERARICAVAHVLPFRVNNHVVDELVDWDAAPDDPMFQLAFPAPGMLAPADLDTVTGLLDSGAPAGHVRAAVRDIRLRMNPHPSGQLDLNAVTVGGEAAPGLQHKYTGTVLYFPRQGQTCHMYCTYCFRWPQFTNEPDLRMAAPEVGQLVRYLRTHQEVNSVLITGGDPMVMSAATLEKHVAPLLDPELDHVTSIRIGTKALASWPHRFTSASDADELLRLFERVVASGRQLAFMAHVSHPRELEPPVVAEALRRIRDTGAVVRVQAPLIRGVNDRTDDWVRMWEEATRLGAVPYYMFVERDTGPRDHFAVPLARAYEIFRDAYAQVGGLARTVRGPVMSATPGKVEVTGVAEVAGERVFVLRLLQARDESLVGRPFFARHDESARWLDELHPALGATHFPHEPG